ncbi:hypothetical protein [Pectobacterium brasiliense]|uniref:hypothetical protein n=1 Tax=Pectobacterium brasiliense TaxID=180957 RepID=UPI003987A80B
MSFVLLVIFAFLTKPILESSMVRGRLGFFKTYFIFGGVVTFTVMFLVMYFVMNDIADMGGRGAVFKLKSVTKALLTIASFYYLMLSLSLYNVARRKSTYVVKLACYLFIFVFIFTAITGIFFSFVNSFIYIVLVFLIYRFVWKQNFSQVLQSTVNL